MWVSDGQAQVDADRLAQALAAGGVGVLCCGVSGVFFFFFQAEDGIRD